VSGLAALIRARFPATSARQVMRRIEATAHHPPAGRDPLVGNGTIDALAAVSTDSAPATTSRPRPAPIPVSSPPPAGPAGDHVRGTAVRGAGLCLLVLVAALASLRLRRRRDGVPGD